MGKQLDFSRIRAKLDDVPAQFADKVATVGWFESAKYPDGTPVAYVAAIQELGAPAQRIPPRPFIRPAEAANKTAWVGLLSRGVKAVIDDRMSADDVLDGVGMQAAADIQQSIEHVNSPALSPITVLLRKWRREGRVITGATVGEAAAELAKNPSAAGGQNADPLKDTGLLIATVSHAVGPAP